MRWMKKYPEAKWYPGQYRTRKKFLLIPRCLSIREDHSTVDLMMQWRWLEVANINQRCKRNWILFGRYWYAWDNINWVEEEKEDDNGDS